MALKGCKVVAVSSCVAGGSDTLGQECGSWSSSPPGAHSQVAGAPRKMVDRRFATLVGGNIIFATLALGNIFHKGRLRINEKVWKPCSRSEQRGNDGKRWEDVKSNLGTKLF